MASKVDKLLDERPKQPVIRRGGDFSFSAVEEAQKSADAETQNSSPEELHKSTKAETKKAAEAEVQNSSPRTKIGWAIRTDLVTAFKTMAVQRRKRDYQIVEEA